MMIDVQAAIYAGAGAALVAIGGAIFGSAFADRVRRGLAAATAELSELRIAHDDVSTRAKQLASARGALDGELAGAREQLDERERQRSAAEARAAELERRLDEAAREKVELATRLASADGARASADEAASAKRRLEAQLAAKDDELKAAKAAAAAATKAALGRTRDMTADGELAAARRDAADLKKTVAQLRSEKDLLSEKLDAQGRLIEAARARSRELQEELKRLKAGTS